MSIKKSLRFFFLCLSVIVFALFAQLWWERNSLPYNEMGRYFSGEVVFHQQSVIIYALLALASLLAVVISLYFLIRKR